METEEASAPASASSVAPGPAGDTPFEVKEHEPYIAEGEDAYGGPTTGVNPSEPVQQAAQGQIQSDFWHQGEWDATVIGQTPGNTKNVQVKKDLNGSMYTVSFREGGELPQELRGKFTSYDVAEKTARTYLNRQWDEHNANATSAAN
jgi:hypothetical protein